jgi:hypothetical protein
MRLRKVGLLRKQGHAECAALDSAQQLVTKVIVHLDEVHLRIVCYERWIKTVLFFS